MSTVADPDVVDLVTTGEGGRVVLVIVEPRLWGSDPAQRDQLRAKLNSYASFILSGQCAKAYPAAATAGVAILVQCLDEPTDDIGELLMTARDGLAARGIGLFYNTVEDVV